MSTWWTKMWVLLIWINRDELMLFAALGRVLSSWGTRTRKGERRSWPSDWDPQVMVTKWHLGERPNDHKTNWKELQNDNSSDLGWAKATSIGFPSVSLSKRKLGSHDRLRLPVDATRGCLLLEDDLFESNKAGEMVLHRDSPTSLLPSNKKTAKTGHLVRLLYHI